MKKIVGEVKKKLSLLLAVAMVIGSIPSNTLTVAAAEPNTQAVLEEAAPVEEATTLAEEETTQVEETTPAEEETTLVEEETTLAEEEAAPVEEETAPVEETERISIKSDSTVQSTGATYTVTITDSQAVVEFAEGSVSVSENGLTKTVSGNDLVFTATPKTGCRVTDVKYSIEGVDGQKDPATTVVEGVTKYTISSANINGNVTITVTTAELPVITIEDGGHAVVALTGGYVNSEDGSKTWAKTGENVTFTVTPAERYVVKGVEYQVGSNGAQTLTASDGAYTIEKANITDDVTITVTTAEMVNLTFQVTNAKVTTVSGNDIDITAPIPVEKGVEYSFKAVPDADKAIKSVYAGNDKLTATDGAYKFTPDADTTIIVAAGGELQNITVDGVKNGVLSQPIDSEASYTITVNPEDATDALAVELVDKSVSGNTVSANTIAKVGLIQSPAAGTQLKVTVETKEANQEATVKIYKEGDSSKTPVKGGEFTLKSVLPAWIGNAPTVSLASATDDTLTLNLTAKDVAQPLTGKLYYKIVVTPKDSGSATKTVFVEYTGVTQKESIQVLDRSLGKYVPLKATAFDVSVSLLQTKAAPADHSNIQDKEIAAESKAGTLNNVSTRDTYYETKLTLKKGTTTVYTGQENVVVATPVFGKNTSQTSIAEATIISGPNGADLHDYMVQVENNEVKLSVEKYAITGTLTIEVAAATYSTTTQPATATIKVSVVRGIENISLNVPEEVYKPANKAASFTAGITYNYGDKAIQPKAKKVTWEILDAGSKVITAGHKLYNQISIKNGKVTINKTFVPAESVAENVFTIRATAADYAGSTVVDQQQFTINSQGTALGKVVIVENTAADSSSDARYKVIAESGKTLTADQLIVKAFDDSTLKSPIVKVLKPEVGEKETYAEEDFVSASLYSLKASNKAVSLRQVYGVKGSVLVVNKPARNLKLTATALDGSKATVVLDKLTINYTVAEALELVIYQDGIGDVIARNDESSTFYGIKNTVFYADVVGAEGITNHKLTVKGGKILASGLNRYMIMATGETLTVTLTNNANKVSKTCTLKNAALGKDSVKVATKDSLMANTTEPQSITYTVTGKTLSSYENVLVTMNTAEARGKNWFKYQDLSYSSDSINAVMPFNDGTVTLSFKDNQEIPAYAYKLNFSFGRVDAEGNFIAMTKEIPVTLKATAPKKVESAKLTSKYTLSLADSNSLPLTLSNKKQTLTGVTEILNANINGQPNNFLEYFELNDTNTGLRLKADADLENIPAKGMTLIGYVKGYEYEDSKGLAGKVETVSQISVTIKATGLKYSLTNATVLDGEPLSTTIKAMASKKNVTLSHVYTEQTGFAAELIGAGEDIQLTSDAAMKVGKQKISLYILAKDSAHKAKLDVLKQAVKVATGDKAEKEAAYAAAMKKYGTAVTTTITVKAKATTAGKLKLASTKAAFSADNYEGGSVSGNYVAVIPYTKVVDQEVLSVSANSVPQVMIKNESGETSEYLVNVENVEQGIKLSMPKKNLIQAVADGKAVYGKALKVSIKAYFGAGTKEESYNLTITMPKQAMTLLEAEEAVKKADLNGLDKAEIEAALDDLLPLDTAVTYQVAKGTKKDGDSEKGIDGSQEYIITLSEGTENKTISVTKVIPATGKQPTSLAAELQKFADNYASKVTNATTGADIAKAAREELKISDYPNLRLIVEENKKVPATESNKGSLEVTYIIVDVKYGYGEQQYSKAYDIATLLPTS